MHPAIMHLARPTFRTRSACAAASNSKDTLNTSKDTPKTSKDTPGDGGGGGGSVSPYPQWNWWLGLAGGMASLMGGVATTVVILTNITASIEKLSSKVDYSEKIAIERNEKLSSKVDYAIEKIDTSEKHVCAEIHHAKALILSNKIDHVDEKHSLKTAKR